MKIFSFYLKFNKKNDIIKPINYINSTQNKERREMSVPTLQAITAKNTAMHNKASSRFFPRTIPIDLTKATEEAFEQIAIYSKYTSQKFGSEAFFTSLEKEEGYNYFSDKMLLNLMKYHFHKTKPLDKDLLTKFLFAATKKGLKSSVKYVLKISLYNALDIVDNKNEYGWTALMIATIENHEKIVKLLINAIADLNHQDNSGSTALMHAAIKGHKEIVELLINAEADVDLQNTKGLVAVMFAALSGHKEIAALLINAKADLNLQNNNGWTAVMFAALSGHKEIAALLINAKADLNHQANNGSTAVMFAAMNSHKEIVELLINAGADVTLQVNNGLTALMLAAATGYKEIVKLLINAGADFNHQDNDGYTALIFASLKSQKEIAALLINAGADFNHQGNDGYTALIFASVKGHKEIEELLINAGANIKWNSKLQMFKYLFKGQKVASSFSSRAKNYLPRNITCKGITITMIALSFLATHYISKIEPSN
ncbi:MAG: Phosphocholine transferase AnkX [Candidatus Anoxychlamydiales bacterium]|nr:Phosphocholine transferase AnkX [Candidatus Anoxychlamydiales bacterium]